MLPRVPGALPPCAAGPPNALTQLVACTRRAERRRPRAGAALPVCTRVKLQDAVVAAMLLRAAGRSRALAASCWRVQGPAGCSHKYITIATALALVQGEGLAFARPGRVSCLCTVRGSQVPRAHLAAPADRPRSILAPPCAPTKLAPCPESRARGTGTAHPPRHRPCSPFARRYPPARPRSLQARSARPRSHRAPGGSKRVGCAQRSFLVAPRLARARSPRSPRPA